jgi:hypothetical protein
MQAQTSKRHVGLANATSCSLFDSINEEITKGNSQNV